MQRSGIDKVVGRGRSTLVHGQVPRARVLKRMRARADASRNAARKLTSTTNVEDSDL
jgi:hypothetical protein